ncbi:MAG: AAA family ATPase [Myxococcota bacterium]
MQVILFVGTQATGKSSFYFARFANTHVRVNLDMLKTRHREKRLFETCLETTIPVVVDNTNPTRDDRARYIAPAQAAGVRVVGYFFESRIEDALRRNAKRDREARIPEAGVRGTHSRLQLPSVDEGFHALHFVRLVDGEFVVVPWRDKT